MQIWFVIASGIFSYEIDLRISSRWTEIKSKWQSIEV